jgi:hypothetical protein
MIIYCVTTHPKTSIALESLCQWYYPQHKPYHVLFREMPWEQKLSKHPQRPIVINCITFIPSLDYPSIWLRKLAISLYLAKDISSWNRLIFLSIFFYVSLFKSVNYFLLWGGFISQVLTFYTAIVCFTQYIVSSTRSLELWFPKSPYLWIV